MMARVSGEGRACMRYFSLQKRMADAPSQICEASAAVMRPDALPLLCSSLIDFILAIFCHAQG